jgi:hypothetical protein
LGEVSDEAIVAMEADWELNAGSREREALTGTIAKTPR